MEEIEITFDPRSMIRGSIHDPRILSTAAVQEDQPMIQRASAASWHALSRRRLTRLDAFQVCSGIRRKTNLRSRSKLFDDLVGACEQHGRDFEAERFGTLLINGQIQCCGRLKRQIGGRGTA
jgi:hypothetical protein